MRKIIRLEGEPKESMPEEAIGHNREIFHAIRSLSIKTTAVLATGLTAIVVGVIAGLIFPATSFAGTTVQTMTPTELSNSILRYYGQYIAPNSKNNVNITSMSLAPHSFIEKGKCPSTSQTGYNTKEIRDNLMGSYIVSCTKNKGQYETSFTPRNQITKPPAAAKMNFRPILEQDGTKEAKRVGLTPAEIGTTQDIQIQLSKSQKSAEIYYNQNATGAKKIKEISVVVMNGNVSVTESWY